MPKGHACITTIRGRQGISDKYEQSKQTIRKLLLDHSGDSWKEDKGSWLKRILLHMRSWLSLGIRTRSDYNDLKKKLKDFGFPSEYADLLAREIEQSRKAESGDVQRGERFNETHRSSSMDRRKNYSIS